MKIITEPHVHVLGVMTFFPHPEYEVPDVLSSSSYEADGLKLIAHAGKGCYDSYGKDGRSIEEHIRGLITSRHGSVLEHCVVSLFISGISRGCSHEIVRHRHFAYSQRSTRYTAEENAAIVLDPYYAELYNRKNELTEIGSETLAIFLESCETDIKVYGLTVETLLKQAPEHLNKTDKRKWARGKARQLLPHALETRMTMTGNIRAWRHFLEERTARGAEPEIRRLAHAIFEKLNALYPLLFADYENTDLKSMISNTIDGYIELQTQYRKV